VLWRVMAGCFKEPKCSVDIAVHICAGGINGIPHTSLRCEMYNHRGLMSGKEGLHSAGCFEALNDGRKFFDGRLAGRGTALSELRHNNRS
jgi:hypothetical protein